MIRVCVIGNSHVAALKLAWDNIAAEFADFSFTFFASHGASTTGLIAKDGQLVPKSLALSRQLELTSGGLSAINPDDYDVFLSYGGLLVASKHTNPSDYSKAVREKTILCAAENSVLAHHLQQLRKVTKKPIFAAFAPLVVSTEAIPKPAYLPLDKAIGLVKKNLFSGLDVVYLAQPEETMLDQEATRSEFSVGSIRLDSLRRQGVQHPDTDIGHMNADYGAHWLRANLPVIRDLGGGK